MSDVCLSPGSDRIQILSDDEAVVVAPVTTSRPPHFQSSLTSSEVSHPPTLTWQAGQNCIMSALEISPAIVRPRLGFVIHCLKTTTTTTTTIRLVQNLTAWNTFSLLVTLPTPLPSIPHQNSLIRIWIFGKNNFPPFMKLVKPLRLYFPYY